MLTKSGKIAHELRNAISNGTHQPGSMLPPIPELMKQYDVARNTVRDAIAALANEGLVTPQSGIGTVVRDTSFVNLNSSLETPHPVWSSTAGTDSKTVIIEAGWTIADEEIGRRLAVEPGTRLVRRIKHYFKGRNVALTHEQWIPDHIAQAIKKHDNYDAADASTIEPTDLYSLMRNAGHPPTATTEVVSCRMPSPEEKEVMGIPAGIPVLLTGRVTVDSASKPLETSDFSGPGDRTTQTYAVRLDN